MFWQASAACASCGASVLVRPWPGLTATWLACTAGQGLGRGTEGTGGEGPGRTCPAPARISAMADRHRAHDPNLARWGALRHPPCKTRTRPVKKCDTLEEYLLTPSNRIWVLFLSLPHPRPWGHAESVFLSPFWPHRATQQRAHQQGHTGTPSFTLIRQWDTPRYHLGGLTFFPVSPFFLHAPPTRTSRHARLVASPTCKVAWRVGPRKFA